MDHAFELNKYLISQKMLQAKGKYRIFDETNQAILYCEQTSFFQMRPSLVVYRDETKREKVLAIKQEKLFELSPTYVVRDVEGNVIGKIRKRLIALKATWHVFDAREREVARAAQDTAGAVFGALTQSGTQYSNFSFFAGNRKLGELKRDRQLFKDRYVLDMNADMNRTLDRRLALCAGIVLDIGERR